MNLNDLDLNKLRTFLAVHEARSMREAASRLQLTPSAVSMSISSLEKSLGLSLFLRSGRRVLPTAGGDRLANTATQAFAKIQGTLADLRSARGQMRGHLRIGVPGEFGVNRVIPAIGAFRRTHKEVSFSVQLGDQNALIPALLDGQFDIVICDEGPHLTRLPQLAAVPVAKEALILACSRHFYRANIAGEHSLAILKKVEHVSYVEHQADLQKWYRHHFRQSPTLQVHVVANHPMAVLAAVRADLGLGLLPAGVLRGKVTKELEVIETDRPALVNEMSALRLKEHVATMAEQAFLRFLTK